MLENMIKKLTVCGGALLMLSSVGVSSVSANSSIQHSKIKTTRIDYRANARYDARLSKEYNRLCKEAQSLRGKLQTISHHSAKYRKLNCKYHIVLRKEYRAGHTALKPQNTSDTYYDHWTDAEVKVYKQATEAKHLKSDSKCMSVHRHQLIRRYGKRVYRAKTSAVKHSIHKLDSAIGKFMANFNRNVIKEDLAYENKARAMYRLPAYQHDNQLQRIANIRAKQVYQKYYGRHHVDWSKTSQAEQDNIAHGYNGRDYASQRIATKLFGDSKYSDGYPVNEIGENAQEISLGNDYYANDLGGTSATEQVFTPKDIATTVNMGYLYYDAHDQNGHRDSILNGSYDDAFPSNSFNYDHKNKDTGIQGQLYNFSERMKLEATGVYFNPITQRGAIVEEFA